MPVIANMVKGRFCTGDASVSVECKVPMKNMYSEVFQVFDFPRAARVFFFIFKTPYAVRKLKIFTRTVRFLPVQLKTCILVLALFLHRSLKITSF